jgi:hypothetical protein
VSKDKNQRVGSMPEDPTVPMVNILASSLPFESLS